MADANKDSRHTLRRNHGHRLIYTDQPDDLGNIGNYDTYIARAPQRYLTVVMQNMNYQGSLLPIAWDFALAAPIAASRELRS
jgi:hypothetical protein